ncbi:MAG: alpha-amylase family glycosyl hydrolase [Chloroflexota bacterium]
MKHDDTAPGKRWWQEGVIYQIYPRSFADANGDGVGDLRGIIDHLDYLNDGTPQSLGIDAIWLSPIYPSPGYDFGYDVSDYHDIDPLFGSMQDFDELVRQAHKRGIRIVLDLVLNHTSHLHPWFIESRASRDNPRRDWYIWRDGRASKKQPNNWQSVFGGPAWTWDETTGQYYLHSFLPEQPDLNWRNPQVEQTLLDTLRFWLDRGVDGFRLDVADRYFKDERLRDNPPKPGLRAYDRQHRLYNIHRPETHQALKTMRRLLDEYPERMMVGEVESEQALSYYGDGSDELHLSFNFELVHSPWLARRFQKVIDTWEQTLPPAAWPCWTFSNHDVTRHYSRHAAGAHTDARARVAAALLLTLRGTPFLYYGEEIGMRQGRIPRQKIVDPPGRRYWPFYRGRDGCRTPMQWANSPNAGFGPVSVGQTWLPINEDYVTVNVAAQSTDPGSLLSFYRRLIGLRKNTPALQHGDYTPLLERPAQALAYLRQTESQTVLVLLNLCGRSVRLHLEQKTSLPAQTWQTLFDTGGWPSRLKLGDTVTLAPHQITILEAI